MSSTRPKVLLLTRNVPPLVGGMERLNWHMIEELSRAAEVRVVAPKGSASLMPEGVGTREVALRPLWLFLALGKFHAVLGALKWRPEVVLAGSGLTAPMAWFAARVCRARAVVYAHGLDLVLDSAIYRILWLPFIRRMDVVIANSEPTCQLARRIGVKPGKLHVVHPGVEFSDSLPVVDGAGFRRRHGLGNGPLLLSVGRLAERKGIREFVRDILPHVVRRFPDAVLMVVGDAASNALMARSQSRESIEYVAREAGIERNLRFLGRVSDAELEEAFLASSLHVFPVRELPGDPEGFGMVAIEAAAHGVPTVAFACGGVVDAVADGSSGWLVEPADNSGFVDKVVAVLQSLPGEWKSRCREFARRKSWPFFGSSIRRIVLPERMKYL